MQFLRRVHPVAFAIGPILFLYARNSRELTLSALALPLLGAVVVALIVWGACRLLQRDRDRAALIASGILLPFFSYGALYHAASDFRGIPNWPYLFFGIWLALVGLLVLLLARLRYPSAPVSKGLNVMAAVFLLMVVFNIARTELARLRDDRAEQATRESAAAATAKVPPAELPNIYYIILDSYGRQDRLAEHFGFDNRPFIRALKQRGFYVAERSNANYCQTITSIPSSLNFRYLDDVAKQEGKHTSDRQALAKLLQHSAVCRVLKQNGYRIVAFPSEYAPITMPSDVSVQRISGYTDFYFSAVNSTPLALLSLREGSILDYYAYHRRMILWQLGHLPKTAEIPGPIFVFAHILAPHLPYVFDAQGHPIKGDPITAAERRASQWSRGEETAGDVSRYCDELVYLNTLVLKTVDGIQANAKRPTVIILQGDHGPGLLPNNYREVDKLEPTLRFGMLNAYSLPGGPPRELYPSISPVNSFRVVFNRYLGTHYPLLKDEHYFSPYTYPYDLRRMTLAPEK